MIKAVIFDVDGTLVDTVPNLTGILNALRAEYGLAPIGKAEVLGTVNLPTSEFVPGCLPEITDEAERPHMLERYYSYYNDHVTDNTYPYEGIPELLTRLKKEGIKLATLSNKDDFNVVKICRKIFPGMMDEAWGKNPAYPGKPDPTSAWALAEKLGVGPEEVAYIGDSDVDMMTGRNAGFITIAAAWGYRELPIVLEAGAQYVTRNAAELSELLENLQKA